MANKEIHELITAEELSASDVIAEQRENSGTWLTRKLTFNALGLFLLKVLNFASDLHTTSKTIIGAINELAQGSGQSLDTLNDVDIDDQTLADGQGIVYDATAQKWKNGAVSGGGHTYSTTEQVVGTWIDGSTLYEKTLYIQALPSTPLNSWALYPHNISNFDKCCEFNGLIYNSTSDFSLYLPHVTTSDLSANISVQITPTDIGIMVGKDRSSYEAYVTIRYTKSST